MVKSIRKQDAQNHLKQSIEFLESAKANLVEERYNASSFDAVQAMMNANDALTIYYLGERASKDHREALTLHLQVVKQINDSSQRGKLREAIMKRNEFGYDGKPTSKKKAEKFVKYAEKFIQWTKDQIE